MDSEQRDHRIVFQTERLLVRPATAADVDLYLGLWTNPEVMRYVGFPQGLRISKSELLDRLNSQPDSAFERLLVVVRKADRTPMGQCQMNLPDEAGIAEPDMKLLPEFWGSGLVKRFMSFRQRCGCLLLRSTTTSTRLPELLGEAACLKYLLN